MSTEEAQAARKPRFDGTINLGHILTAVTMLVGGFAVWTQTQIGLAKQESRIGYLETSLVESRAVISRLVETQQTALRNQDKIAATLDFVVAGQRRQP